MTPQHAKMLLHALNDNIDKYEKKFGEIKIAGIYRTVRSSAFRLLLRKKNPLNIKRSKLNIKPAWTDRSRRFVCT